MIQDKEIAAKVSELMLEIAGWLDHSIVDVMHACPREEFVVYRARANNDWNGSSTYGYDHTVNPEVAVRLSAAFDCIAAHPEYLR